MQEEPIAIIGIGCRFPGADNPQAFWKLLRSGKDTIHEIPKDRWNIDALYDPDPTQPGKMVSRWGGFLDQIDQFDWRAFRMLPREARFMDPQHRLLLEVAWEALEDAGIPFEKVAGSKTSVSIGIGWSDYMRLMTRNWSQIDAYTATGSAICFAANRLSYAFDLRGPSIALDAGCTSSLSAVYLACQSLLTGEAELALAGGVNLMLSPDGTIMVSKAGLLSPDGRCKTFDASADGFVRGEGAGILVLKRLSQVQSSDRVYAHIYGVTVSHNGHNEWIIASSQAAQEKLLYDAYSKAGVDPADVDYVELHGSGFLRGDPIEAKALGTVLGASPDRTQPCMVGSVKTNIGHLEAASGIASIIKVALSLYHREIFASLHLRHVNPGISLQNLHLDVPITTQHWAEKDDGPLLAGVTTLAFTGANAHAVLASSSLFPTQEDVGNDAPRLRLLPISAHTEEALLHHAMAFRDFLSNEDAIHLSWKDLCYTASVRRTHHKFRVAVEGRTLQEARVALDNFIQEQSMQLSSALKAISPPPIVFLFSHQFSQWFAHNKEYYLAASAFVSSLKECDELFQKYCAFSVWDRVYSFLEKRETWRFVSFALQVALAKLWKSWGITPIAVLGEGLGEIAAAHLAGILTLTEAVKLLNLMGKSATLQENETDFFASYQGVGSIPFQSLTAGFIAAGQHLPLAHWDSIQELPDLSDTALDQFSSYNNSVYLDMGLGRLSTLFEWFATRPGNPQREFTFSPVLHDEQQTGCVLLDTLRQLYMQGYPITWAALYPEQYRCISLPSFPWQRERAWFDWLDVAEISTSPEQQRLSPALHDVSVALQEEAADAPLEERLSNIWAEILGLERVSIHDSFFALGGHSLLAIQLLTRIRILLQVEISLSDLFQAPTPASCAVLIHQSQTMCANVQQPLFPESLISNDLEYRYVPFATTDVQQAYWIGRNTAFESGNVGNHAYAEVEANGLDVERFDLALQKLIDRHEMLRAIMLPDGQQKILASVPPYKTRVIDLRLVEAQQVIVRLAQLRHVMDHQLLPIEQWPAFSICIVLLDNQRTQLHFSIESLFVDAWSMHLLIQEFIRLYHDLDIILPPLELSFRDYVQAEEKLHDTGHYHNSEKYWMQRLSSLHPAPELPLVHDPSQLMQQRFVDHQSELDMETWSRLKAHAAKADLTPSGVLLAAFAEVLTAWSKNPRFSINLSIFNRLPLHPEVNNIVGDFTSLIVLAIDCSSANTFEVRARQIQEQLWQDLDHSDYSGVRVLREIARTQGGTLKAIMPIVFTSLLIQDAANQLPAPWQKMIYSVTQTPQVWLDHQVIEVEGKLIFHWQAVDELFPEGLLEAMFSAYCQLLQRLATQEESWQEPIESVVPPSQLEQRALVNATQAPLSEQWLHTPFFKYAHEHPEHPAVITLQRTLSYRQIATAATLLARQLRTLGARPNQLVAVVMEKGWEQVVALYGIVSAGAAFLPLDPHLPQERLDYLLLHSEVRIVVTQSWIEPIITWPEHLQRIVVDTLDTQQSGVMPLTPVQQREDLAYVIYTSGSTGVPKGVMIDHRGAVNTIMDINERFHVGPHDRILGLSAFTFDLSVYDIFGALAVGGTLVLPTVDVVQDPMSWLELIVKERITIWNTVPALLQMLVEFSETQDISPGDSLRLAMLSGDWIPLTLPVRLKHFLPDTEVVSLGGATEASIWSILYPIDHIDPLWRSIPYGRPMRNQYFQVLNEFLQPCPIWVPGYLYIGGIGLAIGYWRDEEKTKASFIYHPRTGERLYRTGDLGRYLPDGNIEFLGREDFQVKVQGYRIELGEIEAALVRHSMIKEAVVAAIGEVHGEKRLAAYLVATHGQSLDLQELRNFLELHLPHYMIPSTFVQLENLPLTTTGKINRKALPEPMPTTTVDIDLSAASSELTSQIVQIVAGVLKVQHIDPAKNLLEYGATSLDIFRIANLLLSQFHVRMELSHLFRLLTINAITAYCHQNLKALPAGVGGPQKKDQSHWEEGNI